MVTATVARKYIDDGVHEPGDTVEVTEARLAELIRMNLVIDPTKPVGPVKHIEESVDPADAAKKGKKS